MGLALCRGVTLVLRRRSGAYLVGRKSERVFAPVDLVLVTLKERNLCAGSINKGVGLGDSSLCGLEKKHFPRLRGSRGRHGISVRLNRLRNGRLLFLHLRQVLPVVEGDFRERRARGHREPGGGRCGPGSGRGGRGGGHCGRSPATCAQKGDREQAKGLKVHVV